MCMGEIQFKAEFKDGCGRAIGIVARISNKSKHLKDLKSSKTCWSEIKQKQKVK